MDGLTPERLLVLGRLAGVACGGGFKEIALGYANSPRSASDAMAVCLRAVWRALPLCRPETRRFCRALLWRQAVFAAELAPDPGRLGFPARLAAVAGRVRARCHRQKWEARASGRWSPRIVVRNTIYLPVSAERAAVFAFEGRFLEALREAGIVGGEAVWREAAADALRLMLGLSLPPWPPPEIEALGGRGRFKLPPLSSNVG